MPLPALITAGLEASIARLLALDPETPTRLRPLAGRVVALRLTDFGQSLYFLCHEQGIDVLAAWEGEPDASLSGRSADFARMGLNARQPGAVLGSGLSFAGDVALAQHFQQFFQGLNLDFEEALARVTGDVAARRLGNLAREAFGVLRRGAETARLNLGEYLREEAQVVPVRDELDAFADGVDELQSDLARLEARLRRLTPDQR